MYQLILLPILAGVIAQIIKLLIKKNNIKIDLSAITAYSGMPSGHSAIVVSLATILGLKESIHSPIFAVSVIFAIMTIRDAIGIRQYLGQHGKILNILVKDLGDDKVLDYKYPHLLEKIGHTPLQVFAGSMIGLIVSLAGYSILN